jgi:hypothetical protein
MNQIKNIAPLLIFLFQATIFSMEDTALNSELFGQLPGELQELIIYKSPLPTGQEEEENNSHCGLTVNKKNKARLLPIESDNISDIRNQPSENFAPFVINVFKCPKKKSRGWYSAFYCNNFYIYDFVTRTYSPMKQTYAVWSNGFLDGKKYFLDGPNDNAIFVTARNNYSAGPHFAVGKITSPNGAATTEPEYCEYESMFGRRYSSCTHRDIGKRATALAIHKFINRFAIASTKTIHDQNFKIKNVTNEIIVYDYYDRFDHNKFSSFHTDHPRLPVVARLEYQDPIIFQKISFITEKTLLGLTQDGIIYCIALDRNVRDFNPEAQGFTPYERTINDNYDIENNIALYKQTFRYKNGKKASIKEMAVDPCYPFHVILYTDGKIKYWNLKTGKISTVSKENIPKFNHIRFYDYSLYFYQNAEYGSSANVAEVARYTLTPGFISKVYDYYTIPTHRKTAQYKQLIKKSLVLAAGGISGLAAGHLLAKRYNLSDSRLYYPLVLGSTLLAGYSANSPLLHKLIQSRYVKGALGGIAGYKLGWYLTHKFDLQDSKLKYPFILSSIYLGAYYCSKYCLPLISSWFMQRPLVEDKLVVFEEDLHMSAIDGHRDLGTLNRLQAMARKAYYDLSAGPMSWFIRDTPLTSLKKAKGKGKFSSLSRPSVQISKEEEDTTINIDKPKRTFFVSKEILAGLVKLVLLNGGHIKLWAFIPGLPPMNVQLIDKNGDSMHIDGPILEAAADAKFPPFDE